MSRSAARRRIADDMAGEDFAAFVARTGGPVEQRAVAVIPGKLAEAMGTEAGVVRLSRYTVVKQRERRRGQKFTAADYRRVQDMLDDGALFKESDTHVHVYQKIGGQVWRAVIKKTGRGDEIYLQSLHRADDRHMKKARERLEEVK